MKKSVLFIWLYFLLIMFSCNSNEVKAKDVPASVQNAFNAKFPGATNIEWENTKENNYHTYEAKFNWKDKRMEAEFDGEGMLIKMHEK